MGSIEQKAGWFFLISGAVALVLLLLVESFFISQLTAGYFGIANVALSSLVMYDLFHRHDLSALRRTVYSVASWLIPCASWIVFIMHRNRPRPPTGSG